MLVDDGLSAVLRPLDPCNGARERSTTTRSRRTSVVALSLALLAGTRGWCQGSSADLRETPREVSRAQAIAAASATSGRIALAAADTALASAQLATATALPNPTLSASYS